MDQRARRKERTGIVISNKMEKSIVVRLTRTAKHPVYKKVIRKNTKVMVHDEKKEAKVGDKVRIMEVRPISKNKNWLLAEVLKQS